MRDAVKKNLCVGLVVNYFLFSMTTPLINLYFIQRVSTMTFSVVNWTSIVIALLMSKFLKSKNNRDALERFFTPIIIIDTVTFLLISFTGEYYINIRFFGLAVLNGTTSAVWMCIMRSNINKIFLGDELTNLQTHQDYLESVAQLAGASMAIVLTKINIGINALITLQVVASITMGYFDYKTIKIIKENQDGIYKEKESEDTSKSR